MPPDWWDYTSPRRARGGIRSQSQRGGFGESWWAKRWLEVLEGFDIGTRLTRGRSYARRGQVLSLVIDEGLVTAEVQGSRPRPYRVRIRVQTISEAGRRKLAAKLGQQARFAAALLAGRMPEDIETVFTEAGLSLFPQRLRGLETECSCPDWSNPCKHIAAVYLLLGEEFDRDPFLLFRLRGLDREALLEHFREEGATPAVPALTAPVAAEEPLRADPAAFWGARPPAEELLDSVQPPPEHAALPKRLGPFPLWRGQERFLGAMEEIYRRAGPLGLEAFLGETPVASRAPRPGGAVPGEAGRSLQSRLQALAQSVYPSARSSRRVRSESAAPGRARGGGAAPSEER